MCWVWCKWGEIREEKLRMILISGLGSWSLTWIIQLGKNFRSKVSSIWCGLYLRHMRHLSIKSRKKTNMQIWISLYVFISMSCDWRAFLMAQLVKNLLAMWDTWAWSLVWEDTLEKGTATYSSILEWWIPWTVELMKSQRVRHNWVIFTHTHTHTHTHTCDWMYLPKEDYNRRRRGASRTWEAGEGKWGWATTYYCKSVSSEEGTPAESDAQRRDYFKYWWPSLKLALDRASEMKNVW